MNFGISDGVLGGNEEVCKIWDGIHWNWHTPQGVKLEIPTFYLFRPEWGYRNTIPTCYCILHVINIW